MKKNIKILSLCIIVALLLAGCGGKSDNSKGNTVGKPVKDIVKETVSGISDFPASEALYTGDEDDKKWFEYLCEFDYDKVNEFGIKYSVSSTADEVFVISLKDESDIDDMKAALKKRIDSRRVTFETYAPDEVTKINGAKIVPHDNIIALIITSDVEGAQKAFENSVNE